MKHTGISLNRQPFFLLILCLLNSLLAAQEFNTQPPEKTFSFKETQKQFEAYKKSNDLSQKKYWKQFKRYEADMQLHTNTKGEPDFFASYINEAIDVAASKTAARGAAAPWYPAGPNAVPNNLTGYMENGIGRVNCVAFNPTNTSVFYVGVAQGGIWKTTNGGSSYTPLTDNLPITRVSDICLDPNNSNIIYASICDFSYVDKGLFLDGRKRHTHYGLGVYKSTDGGLNWNPTGLTFQLTNGDASLIKEIMVNPANSSQLLACGVSGMYKSTDGGNTWVKKLDSLFWDMVQDPVNPSTLYAATGWIQNSNMGHAGIYKTTDFGNTWTLLNTGMPMQGSAQRTKLAIAPGDPNYIYALCCDNTNGFYGIYKSTNAGGNWTYYLPQLNILEAGQGNSPGGQGPYDLALIVSHTDKNTIYTGGINLWGSTDGGMSFNPISHWTLQYGATLHGDIQYMDRQPGTNAIFVCSDGGIYKTNNMQIGSWSSSWPTTWTNLSNGMQCTSFYRLSSSKNQAGRLIAGAQDNASFYYDGVNWSTIFGGDGMDNYLDPLNNQKIIGSSQFGNFFMSINNPSSGNYLSTNPNNESAEWVTPIVAAYNYNGVLYIGNENVVRSTDGGQNWNSLAAFNSYTNSTNNTEISALAVSATNTNVVYAGRRVRYELGLKGVVFRTTNGNAFTNITGNLPDSLFYTSLDVHPTIPDEAVISMAGFSSGNKIFKTVAGGNTWTNISYNLPNAPVNCVKYSPDGKSLIACSDFGVYILAANSTSWQSYSTGLPNVIVSDVEFNTTLDKVYISTFGRGIWATSLSQMFSTTGLSDYKAVSAYPFLVYPTVNHGEFNIEKTDGEAKTVFMEVLDVNGRMVHRQELVQTKTELNLKLCTGVYFVKVEANSKVGVKRVIVE